MRKPGWVMRKPGWCVPVLLMAGCTAESLDPRPASPPAEGEPTTADVARLEDPMLTPAELTSSALTTAVLDATGAAAMGASAEARDVLAYAVGCALDTTQEISLTVGGITYTYGGGLGIAPEWTTSALSATKAAWVSACVVARSNQLSRLIWISMRGNQTGLRAAADERTDFQIEEGAFWGNAFVDLGPIAAYSCDGVDQSVDDSYADLPFRQCAQWDGVSGSNRSPCGMSFAGQCRNVCGTTTAPYAGCSFLGGATSSTVVTTFLAGMPQ